MQNHRLPSPSRNDDLAPFGVRAGLPAGRRVRQRIGAKPGQWVALLSSVLALLLAASAEARVVTLRWTDANPAPSPVGGFRLHVGTSSRTYTTTLDLGRPTPDAGGVFSASATVPDGVQAYVALSAYEIGGRQSLWSNEQVVAPVVVPPPDALPNGQITTPSGAVTIPVGGSVTFAGSGSDPDGGTITYRWDFGGVASGIPASTLAAPGARTFTRTGTFSVSLTAVDDEGNLDPTPATRVVTVNAVTSPPPPPPVVPPPVVPPPADPANTALRQAGRVTTDSVVASAPDGDPRLFVAARSGMIRIVEGGYARPAPFLDLSDSVALGDGLGLLGLAFDPDYASNGFFFVHRVDERGDVVISRFRRGEHPYVADRASELELLRVALPYGGHAGGGLAFGLDGFLFVGLGDGGGVGDPGNLAQDPSVMSGKLLRLDVGVPAVADSLPAGAYSIPSDNPFVGMSGHRPEIWATGLRNPARLSVDRQTGALWIADQGSGLREELDYETGTDAGGHNYGWDVTEGSLCNPNTPSPALDCDSTTITDPIFEYAATGIGCGIVGGHVYRGAHAGFRGKYFFADACTGRVWSFDRSNGSLTNRTLQFTAAGMPNVVAVGLGEGGTGELYVLGADGRTLQIQTGLPACSDGVDNDADGMTDFPADPGCASATSTTEVPLCNDAFDNDQDGAMDREDSLCAASHQNVESEVLDIHELAGEEIFCGLGAELVFVIPIFMGLRRAGRRVLRATSAAAR